MSKNFNEPAADCSKLSDCYVKFCISADLKNPNGSIPGTPLELDQALGRALETGGKTALAKLCK